MILKDLKLDPTWDLRERRRRAGYLTLAGLLAAAGVALLSHDLVQVMARDALWARGKPVEVNKYSYHHEMDLLVLHYYTVTAYYEDPAREVYGGDLDFVSCWKTVPFLTEPDFRYDPADPNRFACSWDEELGPYRILHTGLVAALVWLLALGVFITALRRARVYRAAQACCRTSATLIALPVLETRSERPEGAEDDTNNTEHLVLALPHGKTRPYAYGRGRPERPLFCGKAWSHVAALQAPDSPPVLLLHDLSPFAIDYPTGRSLREEAARMAEAPGLG